MALKGWVTKRPWGRSGGWSRKALKARRVKQGDLRGARGKTERVEPPRRSQSTHSSDEAG